MFVPEWLWERMEKARGDKESRSEFVRKAIQEHIGYVEDFEGKDTSGSGEPTGDEHHTIESILKAPRVVLPVETPAENPFSRTKRAEAAKRAEQMSARQRLQERTRKMREG